MEAIAKISTSKAAVRDVRDNIERHHECFETAKPKSYDVSEALCIPRVCGTQFHHMLTYLLTTYYRRTASFQLVAYLLLELDSRFCVHQQVAVRGIYLVPPVIVTVLVEEALYKF